MKRIVFLLVAVALFFCFAGTTWAQIVDDSFILRPDVGSRDSISQPEGVDQHIVTGTDTGSSLVRRFDTPSLSQTASFLAFPGFAGGVRVAVGDVNGDGVGDLICGVGPGSVAQVNVYDGTNLTLIRSFVAYPAGFTGGIFVAAGDINSDGRADIMTGTDSGIQAEIKVFDATSLAVLRDFFPFGTFTGGARVAGGKVSSDPVADIVVGAGPGGTPLVTVFSGLDGSTLHNFFAYPPAFTGGVYVASGDVNNDLRTDIITGAGPGGGSQVNIFSGSTGALINSLIAFSSSFNGGVRVAAGRVNADTVADIVVGAGPTNLPQVQAFDGTNGALLHNFFAYDVSFTGGVFVAAAPINAPSAANVSVSGRVLTPDGRGLRSAHVYLADPLGSTRVAVTSSFGYYSFDEVEAGQTYFLSVSSKFYLFDPRAVTVSDDLTGIDFIGHD